VLAHGCAGCRLEQSKVGAAVGPPSSSTYEYVESLRSLNGIRGLDVWKWSSRWSVEVEVGVVVRCAGRCSSHTFGCLLCQPSVDLWVEGKDLGSKARTEASAATQARGYPRRHLGMASLGQTI
jgi:hypothetical protein